MCACIPSPLATTRASDTLPCSPQQACATEIRIGTQTHPQSQQACLHGVLQQLDLLLLLGKAPLMRCKEILLARDEAPEVLVCVLPWRAPGGVGRVHCSLRRCVLHLCGQVLALMRSGENEPTSRATLSLLRHSRASCTSLLWFATVLSPSRCGATITVEIACQRLWLLKRPGAARAHFPVLRSPVPFVGSIPTRRGQTDGCSRDVWRRSFRELMVRALPVRHQRPTFAISLTRQF